MSAFLAIAAAACTGDTHNFSDDAAASSTSGAGGASSSGVAVGVGGSTSSSSMCQGTLYGGKALPLDMLLVAEASTSISSAWPSAVAAIKGFGGSAKAVGVGLGLEMFPHLAWTYPTTSDCANCPPDTEVCGMASPDGNKCTTPQGGQFCGCGTSICDVSSYVTPEVQIAPIPGVLSAIGSSLDGRAPAGGAPTGPALNGAIQYLTGWAINHPEKNTALLLVTDGDASACSPTATTDIAAIASAANGSAASVRTYVVAIGANASLDAIAAAGGSSKAFSVSATNVAGELPAALEAVRHRASVCAYAIPQPSMGALDYGKVNVSIGASQSGAFVKQVAGAGACSTDGGWYYDDPSNPTRILLCDATCSSMTSAPAVQIQLGCDTIVAN